MTLEEVTAEAQSGTYSQSVQDGLTALLAKGGLIAQSDINALNQQMMNEKEASLANLSVQSTNNVYLYAGIVILAIGSIWLILKK